MTRLADLFWLSHAEPVSERVLEHGLHTIELVLRRRNKLHPFGFQLFICFAAISCLEDTGAKSAFPHQLANCLHILRLNSLDSRELGWNGRNFHQNNLQVRLSLG